MIPVFQNCFGIYDPEEKRFTQWGNCFLACVASVMEVPLHAIPPFQEIYDQSNWRVLFEHWLSYYNLEIIRYYDEPAKDDERYYIVAGKSPRFIGLSNHLCVWHKGKVVHDPHPDNKGVIDPFCWQLIREVGIKE